MTAGVIVENLGVRASSGTQLLAPVSLHVPAGGVTALTGPSGSGKTTLMRAVLGHLAAGTTRVSGSVRVHGQDVFALEPAALQAFRRRNLALVSQDPGAALNPRMRIGALLREATRRPDDRPAIGALLRAATRRPDDRQAIEVLDRVGLPARCLRRYPGELSGGEQRRIALALALVREVGVLVVDEPLAGLHGGLRNEIAQLLRSLATDDGVAVLVSGHDTEILHRLADDVVALGTRQAALTRLTSAVAAPGANSPVLLRARGIGAAAGRRTLLHSIDLEVRAGESIAVAGPSGAGKTTLARVLAGIHAEATGTLEVAGRPLAVGARRRSRRDCRRIQLIPQNPLSTLNPKHTVGQALSRPLRLNGITRRGEITARTAALLADVELDRALLERYPRELSGGQRQRVAIARALAAEPEVLLCDEITSALDAATAAAIMDLIERTRLARGIGVVVVSHDMAVVARHCTRIVVLADGAIVERGDTARVLAEPAAPQTRALLT
ncbi:ABC transporter ATP-binding protein [Nocardia inohanensis]|uniref:ABC transporter ATP-binding protein n=1 Tax=Nocardia inohanensis TaxID=209246 RepID=UPI000834A899|nr:ATP-binding cassette domain-containing protein [Nocardia inohanensis]